MRYLLGVAASILAGLVFTACAIAQKRAINAIGREKSLLRNLLQSPLWLVASVSSFIIGTPLYVSAFVAIGPTLPPALCSIGLAAVPVFARIFLGERPGVRSFVGAAAVAAGVGLIGLSGISILPESVVWLEPGFLVRASFVIGGIIAAALAFLAVGLRPGERSALPLAFAAGSILAVSNALIGPAAGQLGLLAAGKTDIVDLAIMGVVGILLIVVNLAAFAVAQLALRRGDAASVIPLQQIPIQLLPLLIHTLVYRGTLGASKSVVFLCSGLAALLLGAFAIEGRRPERNS